ncbi:MAG TPA: YihY/virulence factor BrkB family protein [Gaiellales bacterium]|nr:YihY/virulence factor BrkB family protein [Gaiellales bacterium]
MSVGEYRRILVRAAGRSREDHVVNLAQAVAFNAFLAIPSALLVVVGLFATLADPSAVPQLLSHLTNVLPPEAIALLRRTLTQVSRSDNGGLVMIAVGGAVALWSLSGAMSTLTWALNSAYECHDDRGFVVRRLVALAMIVVSVAAFALAFCLLVLGAPLSEWVGGALGQERLITDAWWVLQWPVLGVGLTAAFSALLYLGPALDRDRRRFRLVTAGSVVAVVAWIAASAAFAVYVSRFGSYNKSWGSVSAVIIMLTWLWLASLALLYGAEVNAEMERRREGAVGAGGSPPGV